MRKTAGYILTRVTQGTWLQGDGRPVQGNPNKLGGEDVYYNIS